MKSALQLEPQSPDSNRGLGTFYVQTGRRIEAEPYLKTYADGAKEIGPKLILADYYVTIGKTKETRDLLAVVSRDPAGFASATVRLATMDFADNQHREAYQKVDSVLAREPRNEEAVLTKVRFLLRENKPAEALPLTTQALQANPQSVAGHFL